MFLCFPGEPGVHSLFLCSPEEPGVHSLFLCLPGEQFPWHYLGLLGLVPIVAAIAGFCVYKKKQRGEMTINGTFN